MTSGNPQGSLQDTHPDHLHETGPNSNIHSHNSKTLHVTETKIRRFDENASSPSATSQLGRKHSVNPECHQNTRSQHHQGYRHHRGTKGQRAKPNPPRHRSNQISPQPCCFHCGQDHLILNCPTFKKKKEFQDFWTLLQQDKERIDDNSPTPIFTPCLIIIWMPASNNISALKILILLTASLKPAMTGM